MSPIFLSEDKNIVSFIDFLEHKIIILSLTVVHIKTLQKY